MKGELFSGDPRHNINLTKGAYRIKKILAVLLVLACLFSLAACGKTEASEGDEQLAGGIVAADGLTDEAKEAFKKATDAVEGAEYELIDLLTTQVVAGTNYTFSANKTVDGETTKVEITVYADLEGNCEITNEVAK